jgi:hypothetical protein
MENKFKEGEEVYAKTDPELKLVVRRYVDRVYYCRIKGNQDHDDLPYFERELSSQLQRA